MKSKCFNFVCDRIIKGKAYPALTSWSAEPHTKEWQEFIKHWPYTVPCELIDHCVDHNFPYNLYTLDNYPNNSFYLIGIGFFDFSIDYFALMNEDVINGMKSNRLKVLFYYHEGDDPHKIQQRLDSLCEKHHLKIGCYKFVSGNKSAVRLRDFYWVVDHELLYWRRNKLTPATEITQGSRSRDFTVLSRTHKWWRATVMSDLHRNGILDNSYWSYRNDVTINELQDHNPIKIDDLNLRYKLKKFLEGCPYRCDELTPDDHNNHALIDTKLYQDSYCNIILETFYDTKLRNGSFLSEKTFKAIKHGHPFIIIGPVDTVAMVKEMGYRTFDSVIDHSYDWEPDNTERWRKAFQEIVRIKETKNKQKWFEQCREDLEYNQQLFLQSKFDRLNSLHQILKKDD